MTDDAIERPPHTVFDKLVALEKRLDALEKVLTKAFGERFVQQLAEASDGE